MGDFNIDYVKIRDNACYRHFSDIMSENGFRMLIEHLTCCSNRIGLPQSLLDHAWLNFQNDINTDVLDYLIADHLPISLNNKLNIQSSLNKLCFRDLSQINFLNMIMIKMISLMSMAYCQTM